MSGARETRPHAVVVNEDECLSYIDETWTDMRPASLRRWISEQHAPAD
jgi:MbtH protein